MRTLKGIPSAFETMWQKTEKKSKTSHAADLGKPSFKKYRNFMK